MATSAGWHTVVFDGFNSPSSPERFISPFVVTAFHHWALGSSCGFDLVTQVRRLDMMTLARGQSPTAGRARHVGHVSLLSGSTVSLADGRTIWMRNPTNARPGHNLGLAAMGIAKGCSAELESKVARQVALGPSITVPAIGTRPLFQTSHVSSTRISRGRCALDWGSPVFCVTQHRYVRMPPAIPRASWRCIPARWEACNGRCASPTDR